MFETVRLLRIKVSRDLNSVPSYNLNWLCAGVTLLFCIEILSCQPMKTIVRIFYLFLYCIQFMKLFSLFKTHINVSKVTCIGR